MKVTHPSMSHMTEAPSTQAPRPTLQQQVHTVAPPDDEAVFEQQMAAMEPEVNKAADTPAAAVQEDPLLKKEVDKKMAFEKLMFLSKDRYKEVEYGGLTFKFKVLKSSDNAKIITTLQQSNLAEDYKASVMGLAASMVSVNDIPFEDFYSGDEKITEPLLRKYAELCKWPAFMVTALMAFSSNVQSEVEREFSRDFLKS